MYCIHTGGLRLLGLERERDFRLIVELHGERNP